MRKIKITMAFLLAVVACYAQGIKFETGLNWQQIKEKAKAENKYIFVDCYATWCGPCKQMDAVVYPDKKVGEFMNDRFLSVKLQFDETINDSEEIKKWHETANAFSKEYKLGGYPSFLFFSPDGKLVHKGLGLTDADDFINMANLALTDPMEKLRAMLTEYKQGKKNYSAMQELIKMTRDAGDKEMANAMVRDYIDNYLNKLSEKELCTKANIQFLIENYLQVTTKDKYFDLVYRHPAKVDSAISYAISDQLIDIFIKNEINSKLWKNDQLLLQKPDWKQMENIVANKYPKVNAGALVSETKAAFYSLLVDTKLWKGGLLVTKNPDWNKIEAIVSEAYDKKASQKLVAAKRLGFYNRIGDWKEFTRLRDKQIKENPPKPGEGMDSDIFHLNWDAWDMFLHCNDQTALTKALAWSELAIKLDDSKKPDGNLRDTRANLLYKLGRVREAIAQEQEAVDLNNAALKKVGQELTPDDGFTKNLAKMKAGKPTWPEKK